MEFLNGFMSAALDNNIVFAQLMGMVTMILIARRPQDAVRFAGELGLVALVAGLIGSFFYAALLSAWGVPYMAPLAYVVLGPGASFAVLTLLSRGKSVDEYRAAMSRAALYAASAAVMGVSLTTAAGVDAATATFPWGLGTVFGGAFGVFLAAALFGTVYQRIDEHLVPRAMRGLPIALVTASLMALAFSGVAGVAAGLFA